MAMEDVRRDSLHMRPHAAIGDKIPVAEAALYRNPHHAKRANFLKRGQLRIGRLAAARRIANDSDLHAAPRLFRGEVIDMAK